MAELNEEERTECEVWTRVMGYHRPVSYWNIGKQGEFKERVPFNNNYEEIENAREQNKAK